MSFVKKRLRPRLLIVYLSVIALVWMSRPTPVMLMLGGGLVLAGEALRVWTTGHLWKNDELTVTGPYRYLRHPLYLGTLLIGSGFAVTGLTHGTLVFFLVFLLAYAGYYMPYKERIEGARLEELYGDPYRRYAIAVPKLLPRFFPYAPLGTPENAVHRWRYERFADNNEIGTALSVTFGMIVMILRWHFM